MVFILSMDYNIILVSLIGPTKAPCAQKTLTSKIAENECKISPKKWLPPTNPPTTPQISEASMPLCHPLYSLHIYITWGLLCKEANTLIAYN